MYIKSGGCVMEVGIYEDERKKKYLLRGKNRESLIKDSGEYEDWRED